MPELPELEVVKQVLQRRVAGTTIEHVTLVPPGDAIVVRDLTHRGFAQTVTGATIADITRRGKFILFSLKTTETTWYLVLNPKLTGRLWLGASGDKRHAKTHLILALSSGDELRYVDQKTMGQIYLTRDPDAAPDFAGMGPEPFDISLDEFRARLQKYRGEIKGILTRSEFIAGIGNAYADEILWQARLHPYRKRTQLMPPEIVRLYEAMQTTLRESIEKVRAEMGEQIHLEPRDFFAVHMKTHESCPRCGAPIALVSANQRVTNFCRTCQPGGLIRGM